jgi:hypothetical protein
MNIFVEKKRDQTCFLERENIHLILFLFLIAVKESIERQQEMDNEPWTTDNSSSRDESGIIQIWQIFNM